MAARAAGLAANGGVIVRDTTFAWCDARLSATIRHARRCVP